MWHVSPRMKCPHAPWAADVHTRPELRRIAPHPAFVAQPLAVGLHCLKIIVRTLRPVKTGLRVLTYS